MKREDLERIINYNRAQAAKIREFMAENDGISRDNQHLQRELGKLNSEYGKLLSIKRDMEMKKYGNKPRFKR